MDTINDRVQLLMEEKGLSQNAFAQAIEVSQSSVSSMITKGTEPASKMIKAILSRFNDISAEWLLFGTGEMMKPKDTPIIYNETKPRIPYDASAGTLTNTVNGVTPADCEQIPVIGILPRYDFTIRITGRSMEPEYYAGDEVACMRINERGFIQWGRVHVLDTTQGVVIKRIYENGESSIRCSSFNPEYPDFTIDKADIRSYNMVVGMLRI